MIHTYAQGEKFKIHSFSKPIGERIGNEPRALLVLCHGFYVGTSAPVRVPSNLPSLHFGVDHSEALELFPTAWQDIFTKGLGWVLAKHFAISVQAGEELTDYFLGKGEPALDLDQPPEQWTSYDKTQRVGKDVRYDKGVENAVVSTGYAMSLMNYGGIKSSYLDVATLTKKCQRLSELFDAMRMSSPIVTDKIYQHILFGFCRERIFGHETGEPFRRFRKYFAPEEIAAIEGQRADGLAAVKRIGPLNAFGPAPSPPARPEPGKVSKPLPPLPTRK